MEFLIFISSFLLGISFGALIYKKILEYNKMLESNVKILELENIFKEVLINISNGKSSFKKRYMQTVYITTIIDNSQVDVIYFLDKNDISLLKNNKVINTTHKELTNSIINSINKIYGRYINDIVNVFGVIMSRTDFEKSFNMSFDDFQEMSKKFINKEEESDIDKIINSNKNRFDINEILDKINLSGINSLTKEERYYLNEYSKNT
jgi:hypothetical protein